MQTKVDAIGRMDLAAAVMERPAGDSRRPGLGGAMLELDAAQYDQQLAMLGGDRRAQKLRLVEGFLKIEDWEHAKLLMHWLQVSWLGLVRLASTDVCLLLQVVACVTATP